MSYFSDYVLDSMGNVIPGAAMSVTNSSGAAVTLYSNVGLTTVLAQPFLTNSSGYYEFYANTESDPITYTILAQYGGFSQTRMVEFYAASGNFLQAGAGAVTRSVQSKLRDVVSVTDFGADPTGVADSTAAIQAALATLVAGTTVQNPEITIPAGTYKITAALAFANSVSNCTISGAGRGSTKLLTSGMSGLAVIKLLNARNVTIRDLSIVGETGSRPSYGVQVDRTGAVTGAPAPSNCQVLNCDFWYCAQGVVWTAGTDTNNSEGTVDNCFFETITNDGVSFEHSASLDHTITSCVFSNCARSAINNVPAAGTGGSFKALNITTGGCGTVLRIGPTSHGCFLIGSQGEDDTKLLTTPNALGTTVFHVAMVAVDWKSGTVGTAVQFDGAVGCVLDMIGCSLSNSDFSFPTAGAVVNVKGGALTTGTLTYNCQVNLMGYHEYAGTPTYTNSGSGVLKIRDRSGTTNASVWRDVTAAPFSALHGLNQPDRFKTGFGGATNVDNITGGFDGQEITIIANNGNGTMRSTQGGAGQLFLNANASFVMTGGSSLRLSYRAENDGWYEVGRSAY